MTQSIYKFLCGGGRGCGQPPHETTLVTPMNPGTTTAVRLKQLPLDCWSNNNPFLIYDY